MNRTAFILLKTKSCRAIFRSSNFWKNHQLTNWKCSTLIQLTAMNICNHQKCYSWNLNICILWLFDQFLNWDNRKKIKWNNYSCFLWAVSSWYGDWNSLVSYWRMKLCITDQHNIKMFDSEESIRQANETALW